MRKLVAGSAAVILVAGLGVMFTGTAGAVPPPDHPSAVASTEITAGSDESPNPDEEKRRELRQQALTAVLNGELTPEVINGSTVAKVGSVEQPATAANGRMAAPAKKKDQYVELSRGKTSPLS